MAAMQDAPPLGYFVSCIISNMEKDLKIALPDKKNLYGTLARAKKKSDALVLFVHGFTGHRNEHIFFNAAKIFASHGFDTFRFDLYGGGKRARRFRDTTIRLHGLDITRAVSYFRKQYRRIFVVGHSYGGTSLLFADQSAIDGFIFWDASYIEWKYDKEGLVFNKFLGAYLLDWGIEYVVGKPFVEELIHFPDCGKLIADIRKPVLFVTASKHGNAKAGKKYFKMANNPKKLIDIKGANHTFDTHSAEDDLLEATLAWLRLQR